MFSIYFQFVNFNCVAYLPPPSSSSANFKESNKKKRKTVSFDDDASSYSIVPSEDEYEVDSFVTGDEQLLDSSFESTASTDKASPVRSIPIAPVKLSSFKGKAPAEDSNKDDDNNEDENVDMKLAEAMKEIAISKKPMKVYYENEFVYFEDTRKNQLVALKVRLPSAALHSDFELSLEIRGSSQYFCIKHKNNPIFHSELLTQATVGSIIKMRGREWHIFRQAQEKLHMEMRRHHGGSEVLSDIDDATEPIMVCCEIKLDFICDDIFDESLKQYAKTGYCFNRFLINGVTDKDEDQELITVLSAVLVSKKKVAVKKIATPQKMTTLNLCRPDMEMFGVDDDDDDDDDKGLSYGDPNPNPN